MLFQYKNLVYRASKAFFLFYLERKRGTELSFTTSLAAPCIDFYMMKKTWALWGNQDTDLMNGINQVKLIGFYHHIRNSYVCQWIMTVHYSHVSKIVFCNNQISILQHISGLFYSIIHLNWFVYAQFREGSYFCTLQ